MLLVVGRTGSGKSVYAQSRVYEWHKAHPKNQIIIINHKNDDGWNTMIPPTDNPHLSDQFINWVLSAEQDDDLEWLMWELFEKLKANPTETLLVFDEGQALNPHSKANKTLWTQGRSLKLTIVTLTQRPAHISLFAITQSSEIVLFNIIGRDDLKKLNDLMDVELSNFIRPETRNEPAKRLAPFNYVLYDVPDGEAIINHPVPRVHLQPLIEPTLVDEVKKPRIFIPLLGAIGVILLPSFLL